MLKIHIGMIIIILTIIVSFIGTIQIMIIFDCLKKYTTFVYYDYKY
jgi:hypothetical protein